MKHLDRIELVNKVEVAGDQIGYCAEIGRYLLAHRRAYVIPYCDYYFLTKEQYSYLEKHREEMNADPAKYHEYIMEKLNLGSPDGADYIRDYLCSMNFRSPDHGFFGNRLDGPFLYENGKLYFHLYTEGKHYAVPPMKITRSATDRKHKDGLTSAEPAACKKYKFNGNGSLVFEGFEVEEFEGCEQWAQLYLKNEP